MASRLPYNSYLRRSFASSLPEISLGILGIGEHLVMNNMQPYYRRDIFFRIKMAFKCIFNISVVFGGSGL